MNKRYAKYLLEKTISDYNKIAAKFSMTRQYLSSDILELKKYAANGDNILDLGCGNGRLSELFTDLDIEYTGSDDSGELVKIAKTRYPKHHFIETSPLILPFPDDTFDKVFCLAVFHHIPSTELRLEYLAEVRRILKKDALLILTVWDIWRKPGMFWQILKSGLFYPKLDLGDVFIPFKDGQGKIMANRYIHSYHDDELDKLFRESGFRVETIEFQKRGKNDNGNILIVGKKY